MVPSNSPRSYVIPSPNIKPGVGSPLPPNRNSESGFIIRGYFLPLLRGRALAPALAFAPASAASLAPAPALAVAPAFAPALALTPTLAFAVLLLLLLLKLPLLL